MISIYIIIDPNKNMINKYQNQLWSNDQANHKSNPWIVGGCKPQKIDSKHL